MEDAPDSGLDAGLVRYLKTLVTALSLTMIAGVIVLIALIVMRFNAEPMAPMAAFPEMVALPDGETAQSVTRGPDYLLVITATGRALVLSPDGATLRQEFTIE